MSDTFQAFECDDCKQVKRVSDRVRITLRYEGAVQGTSEVQNVCTECVKADDAPSGLTELKPFRQRKKAAEKQASGDGGNEPSHQSASPPRSVDPDS